MATSTRLPPSPTRSRSKSRSRFKTVLWISLGLTALFVFITSELLLITDYLMYHAYRLQVIADRQLLIPHTLCGMMGRCPSGGPSGRRTGCGCWRRLRFRGRR